MTLQKTPMSPPAATAQTSTPSSSRKPVPSRDGSVFAPFWMGLCLSVAWICGVCIVLLQTAPASAWAGASLLDWAIGISATVSPVALIWMVTAYVQRASDIRSVTDPLRRQLTLITGESGAADARIRRFNQAIREQLDLLRNVQAMSQDDIEAIVERIRQHRAELERFESSSSQQVLEIQDIVRHGMMQIEKTMEDKFTMLRILDGRLQQNGDGIARQVQGVGDQVARMLQEIEQNGAQVADALDRAQKDSRKLADTSRLQEASLTNAATVASETLGSLSGKIDLSVTRFLERASSAREEAERLAQALDAQTRALDDFSTTLPARVSEAETVLRGVADRLYASERLACDQAARLGDRLAHQVDSLHAFMERFSSRMNEIDGGLDRRAVDLNGLAARIGETASSFVESWTQTTTGLEGKTGTLLTRFAVANEESRRNAETVAAHLADTTGRYEDVVVRMRALSNESGSQMKEMTEEAARYLGQFEALGQAASQAGEEVQQRAAVALQNLQQVLERVLLARDVTQAVGDKLVKDIADAVAQNEGLIHRLSETAQMGARALAVASETLEHQEGVLVGKMREGENAVLDSVQKLQYQAETAGATLREQTVNLRSLLSETQTQLALTDQKLKSFAAQAIQPIQTAVKQIDSSAENGLRTLTHYGEGVTQQVGRLQEINNRVGAMTEEMGKTAAHSVGLFESLSERFASVRTTQEAAARQTLSDFATLSDRLQREIGGLDTHASQAVDALQQAALKVGEHSYQMLENARNSGAQLKDVSALLQAEATQIRTVLRQQTEEIGQDLARAEQKFTAIGETIRDRADTTLEVLDRAASGYGQIAQRTDKVVAETQIRVEGLHAALACQADRIETDSAKIGERAGEIATQSGRALQNLSLLNDKMSVTRDMVTVSGDHALERLEACAAAFQRRATDLTQLAETATSSVTTAGQAFGEQAGRLVDDGQKVDGLLRQLTVTTTALADQASQIRMGMEQQNSRLMSHLADAVAQLDVTGSRLQYVVTAALQGADQASARFAEMTDWASERLELSGQDLQSLSERVDASLQGLGAEVTRQAASLAIVGDQIGAQQKLIAEANEHQRLDMLSLFDRLGAAHGQAAEIAERSIACLSQSLADIQGQMGLLGDRSQEAVGHVQQAGMGFAEHTATLLREVQAAEQQTRAVLAATSALQEQARHLREGLQAESARATENLDGLLTRLTQSSQTVQLVGGDAKTLLATLHEAMETQSSTLGQTMDSLTARQTNLTRSLDAQREVLNGLLNRLAIAQDETTLVARHAAERLGSETQNILQSADLVGTRVQSALSGIKAASASFVYEVDAITLSAQQAEQRAEAVVESTSHLHTQIKTIRMAMDEACGKTETIVDGLLKRVTSGSDELRDVAAMAETVLGSMHRAIGDQTEELGSTLEEITERQRTLKNTLDGQDQVLTSYLNRLGAAQGETSVLADQAVQTLREVEKATETLFTQTGALAHQGRDVEQQMKSLLVVGATTGDQLGHLREAMEVESLRVVETLSLVIAGLDDAANKIRTESAAASGLFDQTAGRFETLATSGVSALRAQSEILAQTSDIAEAKMARAEDRLKGQTRLVGEVGEQTGALASRLAEGAEFATTRLVTLRDTLGQSDHIGPDLVAGVCTQMDALKGVLKDALAHFAEASQDSLGQVSSAAQLLSVQSDVLRANLSSSETALSGAASLLQDETTRLPALLAQSVEAIDTATRTLKINAEGTDQTLAKTAQSFERITATARDKMANEMRRLGTLAEEADKILGHFSQTLGDQVAAFQNGATTLSGEQRGLAERAAESVALLTVAGEKLGTLRTETVDTAARLAQEFDLIDQRASASSERLIQAGESLAAQTAAIGMASVQAEKQMLGVGQTLRDQLERIRAGLQGQIDDIAHGLMQITTELDQSSQRLTASAREAVDLAGQAGQGLLDSGGAATAEINARVTQMRTAIDSLDGYLENFGKRLNGTLDQMAIAGEGIRQQEGDTITRVQGVLAHLGDVAAQINETRTLSDGASDHAIQRLNDVVEAVRSHMTSLTAGAQTAAGVVRGVGQLYAEQTQSVTKGVGEAHKQVLGMNESLGEMQQRADRMRVALKLQSDELMGSLRQILLQLEETGDGISETVDTVLHQRAAEALQHMV